MILKRDLETLRMLRPQNLVDFFFNVEKTEMYEYLPDV